MRSPGGLLDVLLMPHCCVMTHIHVHYEMRGKLPSLRYRQGLPWKLQQAALPSK